MPKKARVPLAKSVHRAGVGSKRAFNFTHGSKQLASVPLRKTKQPNTSAMIVFTMADRKVLDDTHHIKQKRGNDQLRREVWVDSQGPVTRYNLA